MTAPLVRIVRLDEIDISNRLRPLTAAAVAALAADIEKRGLRTPIEVAVLLRGAFKYRLISGGHREAAFRELGRETIPAFVVQGSALELRRDQLMENLARNELSRIERYQFLGELKRLYGEMTGAGNGGDRKSVDFNGENQFANLANWFSEVAVRSMRGVRTIEREAAIGERLDADVADRLRGTEYENKAGELEALSKYSPSIQWQIVDQILAAENPARTIRSAAARIEGRPREEDLGPTDKAFRKLLDVWNRTSKPAQKQFLEHISAGTPS